MEISAKTIHVFIFLACQVFPIVVCTFVEEQSKFGITGEKKHIILYIEVWDKEAPLILAFSHSGWGQTVSYFKTKVDDAGPSNLPFSGALAFRCWMF